MDGLPPALTIDEAGCRLADLVARDVRLGADEFCQLEPAAARHGVLPLVASQAAGERARVLLREAVAFDAARTAGLARTLSVLDRGGVRALVLKGAHLALTHYAAPHLRPRVDADLLIPAASRDRARAALEAIGFALVPHVRGDLILAEMQFTREPHGFVHVLDVHWHALNPHAFRGLLPFDQAWARSRPIVALGVSARGLCNADAMLLATTHPAAHHSATVRLIWIIDIDRIAAAMTGDDWADFVARAGAAGVARVSAASLVSAQRLLRTAIPAEVLDALAHDGRDQRATSAYLEPATRAARLWSDVRAVNGWTARARYLRQHLIPDAGYMRTRYGGSRVLLPWYYVSRAAFGAVRWLRH